MNYPAAPNGGIAAWLGQATGYHAENNYHPKGRGIKPLSASGGLVRRRRIKSKTRYPKSEIE
jgi:hypothetical protein